MQDTSTRFSGERTLSRGVEAAREGGYSTERELQILRFELVRQKLSVKQMNFFEQGEDNLNPEETISGDGIHYCSEKNRKMAWMRQTRIKLFTQTELDNCRKS